MADVLKTLNEVRKEARDGLVLLPSQILNEPVEGHLHPGDQFRLKVRIKNQIEEGHGGGGHGDAQFKDIVVTNTGTEYTELLDGQNGNPVPGNSQRFPLTGVVLAEGEIRAVNAWMRVKKEADDDVSPEKLATVRASATFDIERYFRSNRNESVYFDIH